MKELTTHEVQTVSGAWNHYGWGTRIGGGIGGFLGARFGHKGAQVGISIGSRIGNVFDNIDYHRMGENYKSHVHWHLRNGWLLPD